MNNVLSELLTGIDACTLLVNRLNAILEEDQHAYISQDLKKLDENNEKKIQIESELALKLSTCFNTPPLYGLSGSLIEKLNTYSQSLTVDEQHELAHPCDILTQAINKGNELIRINTNVIAFNGQYIKKIISHLLQDTHEKNDLTYDHAGELCTE